MTVSGADRGVSTADQSQGDGTVVAASHTRPRAIRSARCGYELAWIAIRICEYS